MVPFLANPEIAAVVTASMTPARGPVRERAAAALAESFLGGGSHYFRFTPGNLRFVRQFPADNIVVRKEDFLALDDDSVDPNTMCAALNERGRKVLYTPESVVVVPRPPLWRPHLGEIASAGRTRGAEIRAHGVHGFTAPSLLPLGLLAFIVLGWPLALLAGAPRDLWLAAWAVYLAAVLLYRRARGSSLPFDPRRRAVAVGVVAVHLTYAVAVIRGILRPSRV